MMIGHDEGGSKLARLGAEFGHHIARPERPARAWAHLFEARRVDSLIEIDTYRARKGARIAAKSEVHRRANGESRRAFHREFVIARDASLDQPFAEELRRAECHELRVELALYILRVFHALRLDGLGHLRAERHGRCVGDECVARMAPIDEPFVIKQTSLRPWRRWDDRLRAG